MKWIRCCPKCHYHQTHNAESANGAAIKTAVNRESPAVNVVLDAIKLKWIKLRIFPKNFTQTAPAARGTNVDRWRRCHLLQVNGPTLNELKTNRPILFSTKIRCIWVLIWTTHRVACSFSVGLRQVFSPTSGNNAARFRPIDAATDGPNGRSSAESSSQLICRSDALFFGQQKF